MNKSGIVKFKEDNIHLLEMIIKTNSYLSKVQGMMTNKKIFKTNKMIYLKNQITAMNNLKFYLFSYNQNNSI